MIEFQCPTCAGTLVRAADTFECARCGVAARWEDGIVAFEGTGDYFYDVFPRADMEAFLEHADRASWAEAFYELQRKFVDKDLFRLFLESDRGGWKFLLPIGPDATVLDVGCGWGNIALALARNCREVVAVELTRERLRAFRGLARAEGLDNIVGVHADVGGVLPFPDGSFDIVVVNGVMEWIPETRKGRPWQIHRTFLQEVGRVLKPRGVVYLAIENRQAYTYLRQVEDHTGLLWGSLLPRLLSDLYSRWKLGKPYRTYTYTLSGYRRLFRAAGLKSVRCFSPLPDYRKFDQFVDLDEAGRMVPEPPPGTFWRGRLRYNVPFLRSLGHSFAIIASPAENPAPGFLERLLAELGPKLGAGPLTCRSYRVRTCETLLMLSGRSETGWVIRLPCSERQARRTRANAEMLRAPGSMAWSGAAAVQFPTLGFEGEIDGQYVSVESRVAGQYTTRLAGKLDSVGTLQHVADFLADFGSQTRSDGEQPTNVFQSQLNTMIGDLRVFLVDRRFRAQFDALADWVLEQAAAWRFPFVWTHGDFWSGNCLWDPKTLSLVGVVDWDTSRQVGLPGLDLLNYILIQRSVAGEASWGRCLVELLGEDCAVVRNAAWQRYAAHFALDREVVPFLLMISWIHGTWQAFTSGWQHLNYTWMDANVRPVLEAAGAGLMSSPLGAGR